MNPEFHIIETEILIKILLIDYPSEYTDSNSIMIRVNDLIISGVTSTTESLNNPTSSNLFFYVQYI